MPERKATSEPRRQAHRCVVMTVKSLVADCLRVFLTILMKRNATRVKQMHTHDTTEPTRVKQVRMRRCVAENACVTSCMSMSRAK